MSANVKYTVRELLQYPILRTPINKNNRRKPLMSNYLELFNKKVNTLGFFRASKFTFSKLFSLSPQHLGQLRLDDAKQAQKITGSNIPVPNDRLMRSIGADNVDIFLSIGATWANLIAESTADNSTILDIGCGCGRTARFLAENPAVERYIGFDTLATVIDWNRKFILPYCVGEYEFHFLDIYSKAYNPTGKLNASEISFPTNNSVVDLAFAASLFTHLLENDARHYLSEIVRCLKHDGKALVSIHCASQLGENYGGNEFRVEVQEEHFLKMAENAGLCLIRNFGDISGQVIYLFQKGK